MRKEISKVAVGFVNCVYYDKQDLENVDTYYKDKEKDINWCIDVLSRYIEDHTRVVTCYDGEEISDCEYDEYKRSAELHAALDGVLRCCRKGGVW